ncbi:TonB-dependent siderophore receptor [Tritonibacter horizontis]|uniref:Ferrichrome-iron receptor n=1 Tax=Tritonibacter horizontis TaxID=1768241 RepID=A0A132C1V3_9RHOB|nr:TonB-dependent siderophore receptor [Tritonibacter horizontis]KUP94554.1 ferrichrome-iron receptor precursor [Tritonibacter horizontis]
MNTTTPKSRTGTLGSQGLKSLMLGCTALMSAPSFLHAQQADTEYTAEEGVIRLSPIIVTGDSTMDDDANSIVAQELWVGGKVATSLLDTPASVSVITEKEMQQRNTSTVEEVLSYTAGAITDYYGSDDRNDYYLLRGFQASTYRDGLTLGNMRGVREEPFAYQRVEVIRGANSTLFGPSDPGGSVNYVSKLPRFDRFGEAYVSGGSFGTGEVGIDFGDSLNAQQTLAYRLTAKVRDGALEYDSSRSDALFLMGGLTWAPTDRTSVTVLFDQLNQDGTPNSGGYPMDQDYDRSLFFGESDYNFHDVERNTVTAMLRHEFDNGLKVSANLRYSDLSDNFGYIYLYDFPGRTGTTLSRYAFGSDSTAEELIGNAIVQYDAQFGTLDSSTLVGFEYRDAKATDASIYAGAGPIDLANPVSTGAPTGLSPYTEETRTSETKSLFIQQNLSFNDTVVATVGLRRDWMDLTSAGYNLYSTPTTFDNSSSFAETSMRAALTYKINGAVSAYASYVESVAPPSVGVDPERGEQIEVGVKYRPFDFNALFSASIFDLTKNNVTVAVVQPGGNITRELIGENRVRGFELEGKAELGNNISLMAAYSYNDSEVVRSAPVRGVDVEGNKFAASPEHMASVWLSYLLPGTGRRGDMTFGLGARYTGSYYYTLANDNGRAEATTLLDAAFNYQVSDNTQFSVNVSNLLDNQHVVGRGTADYYNPGRTVTATLRRSW